MGKIKTILRYLSIPILIPFIWILRLIEYIQMKKTKNNDAAGAFRLLKLSFFIESLCRYIKGKDPDTIEAEFKQRCKKDGKWYSYDPNIWNRDPTDEEFEAYVEKLKSEGVEGEEDECTYWTEEDWAIYHQAEKLLYAISKTRENRRVIIEGNIEENIFEYDKDINELLKLLSDNNHHEALKKAKEIIQEDENPDEIISIYHLTNNI